MLAIQMCLITSVNLNIFFYLLKGQVYHEEDNLVLISKIPYA